MSENRFCVCGNPKPMQLRSGQYGQFYSCTDWQCKMTQGTHEPQPPIGSENQQKPPPEPPPEMVLHSKKQGYAMRRQFHEKHDIAFPESTQHLTQHLAGKTR